jgi:uncharacterized protein YuzE
MKLEYFANTDSLSITFRDQPSVDSTELSAGVVADYDADGRVVGIDIDIDNASRKVDLMRVVLNRLPGTVEQEVSQCE